MTEGSSSCTGRVPEVVAANGGLEAGAQVSASVVLAELDPLVDLTLTIAKVCSLRTSQVKAKALL